MALARLNDLLKSYEDDMNKLKRKIKDIKQKKEMLLSLSVICPSCNGTGKESYTDAAGSNDIRNCLTCRGLGKVGPIECECGKVIDVGMISIRRMVLPICPWCGRGLDGQYG